MTVKLIGNSNAGTGNLPAAFVFYGQFICETSGTCSEVLIYSRASGYAKVGIYADNGSNYPGSRLAKQDNEQAVTENQWNTITLEATCELVAGTKYWLAAIGSETNVCNDSSTSGGLVYYVNTTNYPAYVFPNPAEDGLSTLAYSLAFQGYGTAGGAGGWTGKMLGVTNPAKINGIAIADIVRVNGVS